MFKKPFFHLKPMISLSICIFRKRLADKALTFCVVTTETTTSAQKHRRDAFRFSPKANVCKPDNLYWDSFGPNYGTAEAVEASNGKVFTRIDAWT